MWKVTIYTDQLVDEKFQNRSALLRTSQHQVNETTEKNI